MEKCSQNQQYAGNASQVESIENPYVKKFGREASPMEAEQTNFMEKTAANNRKRKLSEDSGSDHHEDDLLPVRRCFDMSYYQNMYSTDSLTRDLAEIIKSVELVSKINFSLYGLSATKPVFHKDEPVNADTACQTISKIINFYQDIIDQISCISSKQMKALDEALLSESVSKNTFIKNIHQMIYSLNMTIDVIRKTSIFTSDTNRNMTETNPQELTDLLANICFILHKL